MATNTDFPRASFKAALEVAKKVYSLGGKCTMETCADTLGKKVSGAFQAIVSTASKHNLIVTKKGDLIVTDLMKTIENAYNDEEKNENLQISFLHVPLYQKLYDRFKESKLPNDKLDRILIREYQVDEKVSSRVAKYFVDGARMVELLNPDYTFLTYKSNKSDPSIIDEPDSEEEDVEIEKITPKSKINNEFIVSIKAPFLNVSFNIKSEEHFDAVDSLLKVVRTSFVNLNEIREE